MQNPFVYGEVVPREAFANRVVELDRLTADLAAGQKVFLISPRRYGKSSLVRQALDGREARGLGQGVRYGLAAIIRETPLGTVYGHSGFMPGYQTEARYYPAQKFAVAFQFNSSVQGSLGRSPAAVAAEIARRIIETR